MKTMRLRRTAGSSDEQKSVTLPGAVKALKGVIAEQQIALETQPAMVDVTIAVRTVELQIDWSKSRSWDALAVLAWRARVACPARNSSRTGTAAALAADVKIRRKILVRLLLPKKATRVAQWTSAITRSLARFEGLEAEALELAIANVGGGIERISQREAKDPELRKAATKARKQQAKSSSSD